MAPCEMVVCDIRVISCEILNRHSKMLKDLKYRLRVGNDMHCKGTEVVIAMQ